MMRLFIDHQCHYRHKRKKYSHLIVLPYTRENVKRAAHMLHVPACFYHASPYPHIDISETYFTHVLRYATLLSTRDLLRLCTFLR